MATENKLANLKVGTREHTEFSRLLVNTIQEYAIFLLDPEGRVATWNPGAQKLKGYKADEIIGRHFSTFYPEKDVVAGKPEWELEVCNTVGHVEDEGWRVKKDGSQFWANVVITALRDDDNRIVGYAKVTRDLTERKKHEDQLRVANAKLKKQSAALQALNKSKDEFVSLASHQLRTPASGVKQFLGLILEGYAGEVTDTQRDFLQRAYESNDRQIELVNDLLRVAQVDAGKIILNKVNTSLNDLVKDVVNEQHDKFKQRSQQVRLMTPRDAVIAHIDESRFRMVLENLIDNASKYTPDGGKVTVQLGSNDREAYISVLDTGVGIGEKALSKLFIKFSRIPNDLSESVGGSGLGLYWALKIVRLHDGDITVDSKPGKGSNFTIHLTNEAESA